LLDRLNNILSDPAQLLIVPAALLAIMLHEICHGLAAYRLGDRTAKERGRLSLNPIRHIDVIGLLMLVVAGFGWAKPVPVDMRYFKNPRRDFAIVALAGPVSNFLQALVGYLVYIALWLAKLNTALPDLFLNYYIMLNIGLGVFNLIPVPPLDGSKIVGAVIPDRYYYPILRYERYGMFLLMILLFTGVLDVPLGFLRSNVSEGIFWLARQPFLLFGAVL
jgi:Zn-dependent protease